MRIAVVNLTSGGLSGGYRKYLQDLLPLLATEPGVAALHTFVPPGVPLDLVRTGQPVESWPANDGASRFRALRARIAAIAPDVVFVPTARWLDCGQVPVVVMVRNMEPLMVPFRANPPLEALKNVARARVARLACRRANRVIAVSQHVRDVIVRRWNLDDGKVGVVYHGVETPALVHAAPAGLSGIGGHPFFFTAGSIRPARGLEDVVGALADVRRSGARTTLVIAGDVSPGGHAYSARIRGLAQQLGVEQDVRWAGALDRAGMAWCYERCTAFVMTSRAEACPNVALEAMSHGCVCLSTDGPPMPEFFADAARYYPAGKASSLGALMRDAIAADSRESQRLKAAAAARARMFDWQTTASNTLAQLRLAVPS